MGEAVHVPVLVGEVVHFLDVRTGGRYLDLTLGAGGHARKILERAEGSRLIGVDRDATTLSQAARELKGFGDRFRTVHARFDRADEADEGIASGSFDGIVLDLGISSLQLDDARRGLSFEADGELDMRMDRSVGETAAELLLRLSEREIADLLFRFGDERRARTIARAIVARRRHAPLRRTLELSHLVEDAVGGRRGARIHPATRTFQALRMAVNDELGSLERVLPKTVRWLAQGGRLVVLTFHSGEDRVVKRFFRREAASGALELLNRKVVVPAEAEVAANPRARSAKLRAARRTRSGAGAGTD